MALNHLTLNELKNLIEINPKQTSFYNVVNFSRSGWINFERLSQLLNVEESDLEKSFLDKIAPIGDLHPPVRYCPQCWQYKYHCSLFDLPMLQRCPWHRCELTKGCKWCITKTSLNALNNSTSALCCSRCQTEFPSFEEIISQRKMPLELSRVISGHCDSLVAWINSINQILGKSNTLLDGLFGREELVSKDKKSWLLGLAIGTAGPPPDGWEFLCESLDVIKVTFEGHVDKTTMSNNISLVRKYSFQSDMGHCYKSVKRYISKTYLHNHKDCVKELLHLDDYEAHALDGVFVCPVALAYLSWRMSIEDATLTQLKNNKDSRFSLSFMKPYSAFLLSDRDVMMWSLFSFFCIWHHIDEQCGRNKLRIYREDMRREGHVVWKCDIQNVVVEKEIVEQSGRCHVLFPNSDRLVIAAAKKCDRRRREGEAMLDYNTLSNIASFGSWTGMISELEKWRFSITSNTSFRARGSYRYLYV